jgi:calcium-dependent protein kinase
LKLLKREVEILLNLDHPNIIKLYDVYEDYKYLHLVTEYCSGGPLFDRIVDKGKFSENEAATYMYKIISALNHLH